MKARITLQRLQAPAAPAGCNAAGPVQKQDMHRVLCERHGTSSMAEGHTLGGYTSGSDIQQAVRCLGTRTTEHKQADWQTELYQVAPTVAATVADALLLLQAATTSTPVAGLLHPAPSAHIYSSSIVHNLAQARVAIQAGYQTLKIKVGNDPAADADTVRAIHTLAPAAHLRADANACWSLSQASTFCSRLAEDTLQFLEEPLPQTASHSTHWQQLQARTRTPLAIDSPDDGWWQTPETTSLWQPQYATIKPRFCGGIRSAFARAKQYQMRGIVPVFSHSYEGPHGQWLLAQLSASLPRDLHDGLLLPAGGIATQAPQPDLPTLPIIEQWQWELPCN